MHKAHLLGSALVFCLLVACGRSATPPAPVEAKPSPQLANTAPQDDRPATPAATSAEPGKAKLGTPAPDFTLVDTEGKTHKLSAYKGKTVVLEWFNPDCPFVKYAHSKGELQDMAKQLSDDALVWLTINSNAPGKQGHGIERNQAARKDYAMHNAVLLDETGDVGRAYAAEKTPHMYLIDAKGILVYRGGIDNAPMGEVDAERPRPAGLGEADLVNYVKTALDDMEHNGAIALPDTPPYGCTVKYGS
jgi:peroxiredoxin